MKRASHSYIEKHDYVAMVLRINKLNRDLTSQLTSMHVSSLTCQLSAVFSKFHFPLMIMQDPCKSDHGRRSRGGGGAIAPQFLPNFCKISLFCLKFWHFYAYSPLTFQIDPSLSNSLRRLWSLLLHQWPQTMYALY